MYSPRIVLEKLARFKAKYGWMPVEHSIEEIDRINAHMKTLYRKDGKGDTVFDDEQLTKPLERWIQNERAICAISFEYYLTRYHYISANNRIFRFRFRGGQRVLYNVIQELEDNGLSIEIMLLKARQGGFCLDPETKVLTADLRWIRIADCQPGQEIIAVDEYPPGGKGPSRKMLTGVVEGRREVYEQAIRIGFDDGSHLIATPRHRFMGKKYSGASTTVWREVRSFTVGDEVRYITQEWGDSDFEDGWFGGIIDGEGTVRTKPHSGAELTISQVEGPVLDRARAYLIRNGFTFREDIDDRTPGTNSKLGSKNVHRLIVNRMDELMRLVGKTRPCRMLNHRWWDGKGLPGKCSGIGWRKIVSLEILPPQRMIDLQTSTKTFIASGYVSHNSTFVEALMTHRALFVPGVKCTIGSANDQKTYVMMGMMYTALENLPWWLPPQQTKDKRSGSALLEFAHVGSQIVIQSGSIRGGIGQGTTPTAIHLSEVCDYTNPLEQIEEGLFKAVHPGPEILMVLESTGNGNATWWAKLWYATKRLYRLFVPWFMTPELYPSEEWMKQYPMPENWTPNPRTIATIAKCEAYAHCTEALIKVLGAKWKMPVAQQWFWEFNFEDAKERGIEKSWLRHMPCDSYDALIGENDAVFDQKALAEAEERRAKTVDIYGVIGDGIAEKHDPPAIEGVIDPNGTRIAIPWKTPHEIRLEWILMPLMGDYESPSFDPLMKLLIWRHPEKGARYSIGLDTGTGVGGDRSIIDVNKCGEDAVPDVQVAQFVSDSIGNTEIYAWALAIGAYYSQFYEDEQTVRFVIEQRRKYGDSCYHALKLHGMTNHHHFREYDKKTLRPKPSPHGREGWWTNEWSRPLMIGTYKHAVENGWMVVNSKLTLGELEALEQVTTPAGKTRQDHRAGGHDDSVFSGGMAYFTFHDNDLMGERSKKKYNAGTEEGYDVDYRPWVQTVPNLGATEFFERYAQ